jgi:alpha-1,2-mannosyltransferase
VGRQLDSYRADTEARILALALAVAIWLEPVRATVSFGQINLILLALVIVDFFAIRRQSAAGFLIGIAAGLKLTPLAFIPYLFVIGRRRAALNACVGFAACLAIGFAADPAASRTYWGQHRFASAHLVGRVENASNQSVRGIIARLLRTTQVPTWWLAVAIAVFVVGLVAAAFLYQAGQPVWSLTAMGITMLTVSPISWSHHWVWCVPMLLVGVDLVRRHQDWRWTLVSVAVTAPFAVALIFWAPHANHQELTDSALQQLASTTYVLAGALLIGAMCLSARVDVVPLERCQTD